jgi:hypothetical protein
VKRLAHVAAAYVVLLGLGIVVVESCTPAQRHAVPAAERAICVVLRASGDPDAEAVCATADELAPFVAELLAAREGGAVAAPIVAFSLPAPRRAPARRRCVSWLVLDAGAEAAP